MMAPFSFTRNPRLNFGVGSFRKIPEHILANGRTALLVTGRTSYKESPQFMELMEMFRQQSIKHHHFTVQGEPSPEMVDAAVSKYQDKQIDCVVAWGGGSAIDCGKAISAMLPMDESVVEYLEGVGSGKEHPGVKTPFIAVPTTAGTGSEATENAVLSQIGPEGFKKSLRHTNFVPDIAVIDPALSVSCPSHATAACGMDTLSQLIESYVSSAASPLSENMAFSGIEHASKSLVYTVGDGCKDLSARSDMAYASFLSGICLSNTNLGVVHGIAGLIGGMFYIPHGVVCGSLLAVGMEKTIEKLQEKYPDGHSALEKFAKLGRLFSGKQKANTDAACELFVERLYEMTEELGLPLLGEYGIRASDLEQIVKGSGNKNNPIHLDQEEMTEMLKKRL